MKPKLRPILPEQWLVSPDNKGFMDFDLVESDKFIKFRNYGLPIWISPSFSRLWMKIEARCGRLYGPFS